MVYVVLPCYNEELALPIILESVPSGFNIIVADNGSTDGSKLLAQAYGAVVVDEGRRGIGYATNAGLREATSEIICVLDCDGTVRLEDLLPLITPIAAGHADLVIATRSFEAGSVSPARRALFRLAGMLVNRLIDHRVTDLGSARAFRREIVKHSLDRLGNGTSWSIDLVRIASMQSLRIVEIPTPFYPRYGISKVTGTLSGAVLTSIETLSSLIKHLKEQSGISPIPRLREPREL